MCTLKVRSTLPTRAADREVVPAAGDAAGPRGGQRGGARAAREALHGAAQRRPGRRDVPPASNYRSAPAAQRKNIM